LSLESDLIHWLEANLPAEKPLIHGGQLTVGLGDDAAALKQSAGAQTVVTTDLLTDGVDFLVDGVAPERIGHKALGVNLSDIAAMAARPVAAFVSLVLPRCGTEKDSALELAKGLYRGMMPLAEEFGVVIAGGDTNSWEGPLAISLTVIGDTTARGALTRSGGRWGDQLLVTGKLGGSILGRHFDVEPRVREALLLHEQYELTAGMDISDGLALDTARLAKASGCGAVVDLTSLPLSDAAHQLSEQGGCSAVEHALGDGEDFELVLAVSREDAERVLRDQPLGDVPLTRIGELAEQPGLWQVDEAGRKTALEVRGFQHDAE